MVMGARGDGFFLFLFFFFVFAVRCAYHSGGCGWFLKFLRWILFIYFNEFFILF